MEQAVHDRGGWPTGGAIDRTEHQLAGWELLTDALVGALAREGVMNVDELRRGIEGMPREKYERASYYERWLYSLEAILKFLPRRGYSRLASSIGGSGDEFFASASGC